MDYTQNPESESQYLSNAISNSDTVLEQPAIQPEPAQSTAEDFKGGMVPLQVRVPSDLRESLRLLAIDANEPMSDLVFRCLTTNAVISRAWIQTRKKVKRAA